MSNMKVETLPTCCAELWDPLGEEDGSRSIVIGIGSFFAASINWRHLNDSRRELQEEVDGHMDLFDARCWLRHCACLKVLTQNRERSQTLPSLLTRPILRRYAHQTTKKYASYTTTGCSPPATCRGLSPWFLSFSLSRIPTTKNAPKRARVRAPSWTQRNLIRKSVLFRGDIQCQYARQKITERAEASLSPSRWIKSSWLQVQDGCEQSNMARAKRLKTTP